MVLYRRHNDATTIGFICIFIAGDLTAFARRSLFKNDTQSFACPAIQPFQGAFCPGPFVNGNACVYGEFCCPEQGGACTPATTCSCPDYGTKFGPFSVSCIKKGVAGSLPCQSVCPEKSPAGNFTVQCDIDYRYLCVYGDAISCADTTYSYDHETECWCDSSGRFVCQSNVCPKSCPLNQPRHRAPCSGPFVNDNACFYGEFCCPGEGKPCVPDKKCSLCGWEI